MIEINRNYYSLKNVKYFYSKFTDNIYLIYYNPTI